MEARGWKKTPVSIANGWNADSGGVPYAEFFAIVSGKDHVNEEDVRLENMIDALAGNDRLIRWSGEYVRDG